MQPSIAHTHTHTPTCMHAHTHTHAHTHATIDCHVLDVTSFTRCVCCWACAEAGGAGLQGGDADLPPAAGKQNAAEVRHLLRVPGCTDTYQRTLEAEL